MFFNQLACAWCQVAHKHWGISLSQLCFISNTWYVYNNFQLWASDISNKGQIKNMWSFARNKEVQIYSVMLIRTLCFIMKGTVFIAKIMMYDFLFQSSSVCVCLSFCLLVCLSPCPVWLAFCLFVCLPQYVCYFYSGNVWFMTGFLDISSVISSLYVPLFIQSCIDFMVYKLRLFSGR